MFGTLKPGCLPEAPKATHSAFYCGLCAALGADHGLAMRGLVSYDAVLLGILVDSLQEEPAPPAATRCPLLPVVHQGTVAPESPAMRFAAAAQVLLADQWLADRGMDGGRLTRAARPLLAGPAEVARGRLRELGLDPEPLAGFEHRQAAVEAAQAGPEAAAAPTAEALGLVFGWIGALGRLEDTAPIQALGLATGRLIYLIDAVEDVEGDRRAGAFNPLLRDGEIDPARVEAAARLLRADLRALSRCLADLPLRRHREVIESVLIGRLGAAARRALHAAQHLVEPADLQRRSAFVAAFAWVLLLLFGLRPAWAEPKREPSSKKGTKKGTKKGSKTETETKTKTKTESKSAPPKSAPAADPDPDDPAPPEPGESAGSGEDACCVTDTCCDPCLNACCGGCERECDSACNSCCGSCNSECNRSAEQCCNCNNCCNQLCQGNNCCGGSQCASGKLGAALRGLGAGGAGRGAG